MVAAPVPLTIPVAPAEAGGPHMTVIQYLRVGQASVTWPGEGCCREERKAVVSKWRLEYAITFKLAM